jgi:hypothetical protein
MMPLIVEVCPANRPGSFEAWHNGELVCVSTTPLLSACRRLLMSGAADPNDVAIMKHRGSKVEALRARVAIAAGLTVVEGDRRPRLEKYRAFAPGAANSRNGSSAHALNRVEATSIAPDQENAPTGATVTVGDDP